MNKCYLLLPIFTFSLRKLWCQFDPKKCWGDKDQSVGDSSRQPWLSPVLVSVASSSSCTVLSQDMCYRALT